MTIKSIIKALVYYEMALFISYLLSGILTSQLYIEFKQNNFIFFFLFWLTFSFLLPLKAKKMQGIKKSIAPYIKGSYLLLIIYTCFFRVQYTGISRASLFFEGILVIPFGSFFYRSSSISVIKKLGVLSFLILVELIIVKDTKEYKGYVFLVFVRFICGYVGYLLSKQRIKKTN